jgi:hypothetical protein
MSEGRSVVDDMHSAFQGRVPRSVLCRFLVQRLLATRIGAQKPIVVADVNGDGIPASA